jgi:hypothetical protein
MPDGSPQDTFGVEYAPPPQEEGLGTRFLSLWGQLAPEPWRTAGNAAVGAVNTVKKFMDTPYSPGLRREDVTDIPATEGGWRSSFGSQPNDPAIAASTDAAALTLAPLGTTGPEAGTVLTAGRRLARGRRAAAPVLEDIPPPPIGHNMPPEPTPVETPAAPVAAADQVSTGRRTMVDPSLYLRDKTLADAMGIASKEGHIIPNAEGGFVGAPYNLRSPEDLQNLRKSFDEAARLGASVGGEKWYEQGRNVVSEIAPNNPALQAQMARTLGLTSSQATPEVNLGFALQAHNAWEGGEPADLVRTTLQAEKYNRARATGEPIELGPKTEIYGINLDPNQPWTTTGTNDIWHARALGYTDAKGRPWDEALSPQQHQFMDAETVLAVKRANEEKWGGRSDWTAPEIQAAAWVGRRAQAKGDEKLAKLTEAQKKDETIQIPDREQTIANELAKASKGYGAALEKHTAYGTSEATPGVGTGHLPAVAEGSPELRAEYAQDPRSTYSPPGAGGYDIYHGAMGMLRRPTLPTTGIYEGPKGTEVNQGEAARILADIAQGKTSGEATWSPVAKRMITAAEAAKGYVGAQNMSAASMLFPKNKPGRLNSLQFDTGGQWSPEQIDALKAIGKDYDIPDLVHLGDKAYLSQFPKPERALSTKQEAELGDRLSQALGRDVNPQRTEVASTSTWYGDDWKAGEGSGAATRTLRKELEAGPNYIAKLDASPEIRTHVLGLMQRDAEWAARTGSPVRQDLQNARDIISKEGFAGLFKALDAGKIALPSAMIGTYLGSHLLQQQNGS